MAPRESHKPLPKKRRGGNQGQSVSEKKTNVREGTRRRGQRERAKARKNKGLCKKGGLEEKGGGKSSEKKVLEGKRGYVGASLDSDRRGDWQKRGGTRTEKYGGILV